MTHFQDIDHFIQNLEQNQLIEDYSIDAIFSTAEDLQKELNRLNAINKDKLHRDNQLRLEARKNLLKEILGEQD